MVNVAIIVAKMSDNQHPNFGYIYPRPAVTTDCVIFGFDLKEGVLKMLLIERGIEPYQGKYALPGGFLQITARTNENGLVIEEQNESLPDCAMRELREETGLKIDYLEELGTWSTPGRDPRCITITDAYYALTTIRPVKGGDDAADAKWVAVSQVLDVIDHMPQGMRFLAFDHDDIVRKAVTRLQRQICFEPLVFKLLPKQFSMSSVQKLYESILDKTFDRRNFARKLLDANILKIIPVDGRLIHYEFDPDRYAEFMQSGKLSNLIFN